MPAIPTMNCAPSPTRSVGEGWDGGGSEQPQQRYCLYFAIS